MTQTDRYAHVRDDLAEMNDRERAAFWESEAKDESRRADDTEAALDHLSNTRLGFCVIVALVLVWAIAATVVAVTR